MKTKTLRSMVLAVILVSLLGVNIRPVPQLSLSFTKHNYKPVAILAADGPEEVLPAAILIADGPEEVPPSAVLSADGPEEVPPAAVLIADGPEEVPPSAVLVADGPEEVPPTLSRLGRT